MNTDVYVHFDTLSLKASAAILGVGVALFNIEDRDAAPEVTYLPVSLESQEAWGRDVAQESLEWWRSEAPYTEPLTESGMLLSEALARILNVVEIRAAPQPRLWIHSAMLEGAVLQSLLDLFDVPDTPWRYWDVNEVRTFLAITARYTATTLVQPYGVSPRDHMRRRVELIHDLHAVQGRFSEHVVFRKAV